MSEAPNKPGMRWPMILGGAGFAAGFFGPIVFVPEANQGPLVGIFISGPGGALLGLVLLGICALLGVSAQKQWKLLWSTVAVGVLVILVAVQPQPERQGLIFTAQVISCASPIESEALVLEDWNRRIAEVTWQAPRPGWQADMRAALREAPGVVIQTRITAETIVLEHRKPWNRGKLSGLNRPPPPEIKDYYDADATCSEFPEGREITAYQDYMSGRRIEPPKTWPPREVERFIGAAEFSEVPPRFAAFH